MQLTEAQSIVLLAIAARKTEGFLEESIEQYALRYISDPLDVGETIDQFEELGWIDTEWEVLTGEKRTIKTRRCRITEEGERVSGNPKPTPSPPTNA